MIAYVLILCLLFSTSHAQVPPDPSADTYVGPQAASVLVPDAASISATPEQFRALGDAEKNALVSELLAGVAKAKADVDAALKDPSAAFATHVARFHRPITTSSGITAPGSPKDSKTLAERKKIFVDNLKRYQAANAVNPLYAEGITQFSHLTQEEFKAIMLPRAMNPASDAAAAASDAPTSVGGRKMLQAGLAAVTATPCGKLTTAPPAKYTSGTPPTNVNWLWNGTSLTGNVSAVRDQDQCGSCVAFGSTALAEHVYLRKYKVAAGPALTVDFSEQALMDCCTETDCINQMDMCQGADPALYLPSISCKGMAHEATVPYYSGYLQYTNPAQCTRPTLYNQALFQYYVSSSPGLTSLARLVSQTVTMISVDATVWSGYSAGVAICNNPGSQFNHAVAVVGYISGLKVGTVTMDVWLVRNSWGAAAWGANNPAPYKGYLMVQKNCAGNGPFLMYNTNNRYYAPVFA